MFKKLTSTESDVLRQTIEELGNVTNHIEKGFGILSEIMHMIAKKEAVEESYKRGAVVILSYRILRILRSAYWCMVHGYYDVAMALLRLAFETHLLLYFLSKREKEAKQWFEGKEFRPAVAPSIPETHSHLKIQLRVSPLALIWCRAHKINQNPHVSS